MLRHAGSARARPGSVAAPCRPIHAACNSGTRGRRCHCCLQLPAGACSMSSGHMHSQRHTGYVTQLLQDTPRRRRPWPLDSDSRLDSDSDNPQGRFRTNTTAPGCVDSGPAGHLCRRALSAAARAAAHLKSLVPGSDALPDTSAAALRAKQRPSLDAYMHAMHATQTDQ